MLSYVGVVRFALAVTVLIGLFGPPSAAAQSTIGQRGEWALQDQPSGAIYVDIPSTGSTVANWMLGAVAGQATWMDQLTRVMAMGAERPVYLIVGGEDHGVARKATQAAIRSFAGRSLPHLTLVLIGPQARAERLRPAAEALGITYVVRPPPE